jgi:hypothetical protein
VTTLRFRTGTVRSVHAVGQDTGGTVPVRAAVSVNPGAVRAVQVLHVPAADVARLALGVPYAFRLVDGRITVLAVGRDDVQLLADALSGKAGATA